MRRDVLTTPLLLAALLAFELNGVGQIQVSQEPRHHVVFENDRVRILDVHIPAGDTTLLHKHSTPSVFLVLSNTRTGSQVLVEPARINLTAGNIWFESFADKPRIHRVWNSDTLEFHVIDMELLHTTPLPIDSPLDPLPEMSAFSLLFDELPVRGYRFSLPARHSMKIDKRKVPLVIIGLTNNPRGTLVNDKSFQQKGDFLSIPAGEPLHLANIRSGAISQDFALFELK